MQSLPRRRILSLALGLPALALGASLLPGTARADDVKAALDDLAKARSSLKTLVASFVQTRQIGLLATEVKSKGELTLVRPDKLRWELLPPDATTYWIIPSGVYFRSGSTGKATKAPAGAGAMSLVLADIMTFLGGDLTTLSSRYDLSVPSRDGGITLVAVPKSAELKKVLARLEIKTTPELWCMSRVVMDEATGDKSVIEFGKNERDVTVDPRKMEPPAA
jgi:outer membrane lipoprotein-sorting protein